MKVASALVSGRQASPELAERAVREALAAAGLSRAASVLLFLTRDFARQAQPAVIAASRAAGSLQVFGSTASGLFTENEVLLDQPGAAALVIGEETGSPAPAEAMTLAFSGHSGLPFAWQDSRPRAGLLDSDAQAWSHGRLSSDACAEFAIPGRQIRQALSTGLRQLGPAQPVDDCAAYELRRLGGQSAVASLRRALPAELRDHPPLHQISLLRRSDEPGIAILSANADGSLTLAEALSQGEAITWAIRQPLASEQDMHQALDAAAHGEFKPDFALMFSCIGRGPLFYGGEDRDQMAFREHFPGRPLLGVYGNGQIASSHGENRLFHNSVITLLIAGAHV
ncbi:MAG: FIST C-terminal domain-containing protein [Azonexus sp.]